MANIKKLKLALLGLFLLTFVNGQTLSTKKQGNKEMAHCSIRQEQKWWNLLQYDIDITPDYGRKYINGTNSITFSALQPDKIMQIDLQAPMRITDVRWRGKSLVFKHSKEDNYLVIFPTIIKTGKKQTISIHFEGETKETLKPPYDNGWIWAKELNGRTWNSVACGGSGGSHWLPCKDVLNEKPD